MRIQKLVAPFMNDDGFNYKPNVKGPLHTSDSCMDSVVDVVIAEKLWFTWNKMNGRNPLSMAESPGHECGGECSVQKIPATVFRLSEGRGIHICTPYCPSARLDGDLHRADAMIAHVKNMFGCQGTGRYHWCNAGCRRKNPVVADGTQTCDLSGRAIESVRTYSHTDKDRQRIKVRKKRAPKRGRALRMRVEDFANLYGHRHFYSFDKEHLESEPGGRELSTYGRIAYGRKTLAPKGDLFVSFCVVYTVLFSDVRVQQEEMRRSKDKEKSENQCKTYIEARASADKTKYLMDLFELDHRTMRQNDTKPIVDEIRGERTSLWIKMARYYALRAIEFRACLCKHGETEQGRPEVFSNTAVFTLAYLELAAGGLNGADSPDVFLLRMHPRGCRNECLDRYIPCEVVERTITQMCDNIDVCMKATKGRVAVSKLLPTAMDRETMAILFSAGTVDGDVREEYRFGISSRNIPKGNEVSGTIYKLFGIRQKPNDLARRRFIMWMWQQHRRLDGFDTIYENVRLERLKHEK